MRCGKVFAEEPPDPGHFPTIEELTKKLSPSGTKELPPVGVKSKLSDPDDTPFSPANIMDVKQAMECFDEFEGCFVCGSQQE